MSVRGLGITVGFVAWDTTNNVGKTGDSANFTLRWGKDGTYSAPTNSASEVDATNAPGEYKITLTNAEANCDFGELVGKSSTSGISIMPTRVSFDSFPATRINIAQAGASGTITLDASASATDSLYNGLQVEIIAGTGAGQGGRIITGYVGSTKVATVTPSWTTTPDSTSVFALVPATVNVQAWTGTVVATPATAGVPDVNAKAINNISTSPVTTVKPVIGLTTADTISALGAGTITAASIAAAALNGKGDWLLASSYTAPPSAATIAALIVTGSAINSNELNTLLSDYGLQTLLCGISGDVGGRILGNTGGGGGGGITTGPGVWAEDGSGNAIAPASTALSTATWTNARAANLDNLTGVTFPTNFGSMSIDANGRVKIQSGIPKNTALAAFGFFMCDSVDHVTGKTGLTITATRSLDGAAPGACANSATEVGGGKYKIDLAAADLNGNTVVLTFSGTGADDRIIEIVTTP